MLIVAHISGSKRYKKGNMIEVLHCMLRFQRYSRNVKTMLKKLSVAQARKISSTTYCSPSGPIYVDDGFFRLIYVTDWLIKPSVYFK
jgi:hypothetical protein